MKLQRLNNIVEIKGTLLLKSGLHIGSGDNEMHIGGTDNPVIKHPHTNEPYIPGSSIKGKTRSLLEWYLGLVAYNEGKPFGYQQLVKVDDSNRVAATRLIQLFGVSGGDNLDSKQAAEIGPTRLSFRDCSLTRDWVQNLDNRNLPRTETKFENSINRIAGTAENPRNTERVPEGAVFDFCLALKILEGDDEAALTRMVLTGFKLLEMDALGGSGSRGYGKVQFQLAPALQAQLDALQPFTQKAV
jgi:CRISPR-associated protein Csm3